MGKTAKAVGLFIAAALTVYACSDSEETYTENEECYDDNNDGYCDDDGSQVGDSYIDIDGKKKFKKIFSGVTSGAKAGIGSSGISSSG